MNDGTVRVQKGWLADLEAEHAMWRETLRQIRAIHAPAEHDECGECELLWPCATAALAGFAERERADVNEELRRRIEERRDEHEAIAARPGGGDNCQAYANALSWVLDLLDAQPAAVSLPTAFVRATTDDGLELWLEHDEGDALVHAGPAPTGSLALFVRGTISLPEEAEPAGICGWRLTEWDRCTRPADHEGACA